MMTGVGLNEIQYICLMAAIFMRLPPDSVSEGSMFSGCPSYHLSVHPDRYGY